jgi:response regulator RpfG family c-di-GMP phosphodiesterase/serine/threonine protein kinase
MDSQSVQKASTRLDDLLRLGLISPLRWRELGPDDREKVERSANAGDLIPQLVTRKLLTPYQAKKLATGMGDSLVLGNYRVLDRLGVGGAGVVFKGQHVRFGRPVAIKVIEEEEGLDPEALPRFFAEMEAIGKLKHPNIVAALDAGQASGADGRMQHYFVMEFVSGEDLHAYVTVRGPLPPARACDLIFQVAGALASAHEQQLIHRDVKPSNILLTPEGKAVLVDFGLARHFSNRMTEQGQPMGTLDYMAPEQVRDSSAVDERADVFGLGATLFWCLTRSTPFPSQVPAPEKLLRRMTMPAVTVRSVRPEVSSELDALVARMLALEPERRPPTMAAVQQALRPFLETPTVAHTGILTSAQPEAVVRGSAVRRVLIVDDDPLIARVSQRMLEKAGLAVVVQPDGKAALQEVQARGCDLVLLDIEMPGMSGLDVLKHLRETPPRPHLKVIMCSSNERANDMAQMLLAGADDYVTKPVSEVQLKARVKAALLLQEAQDRTDLLHRQLRTANAQLECDAQAREGSLVHARDALLTAIARLVEHRWSEANARLRRLPRYVACLAEDAARLPAFAGQIDRDFVRTLEICAPLHDIGMVTLPDHILHKPGKLTPEERVVMEAHTTIGADTLREGAERYALVRPFLQVAIDIARHHHERYDGTGYPDRLVGDAIPLTARLVAFGDVYDALRRHRPYRPAFPHPTALRIMFEGSPGHFDPALLSVFRGCSDQFERVFRET